MIFYWFVLLAVTKGVAVSARRDREIDLVVWTVNWKLIGAFIAAILELPWRNFKKGI